MLFYVHVVDTNHLDPIWFELEAAARANFRLTLKDMCRETAQRLRLAPPVIPHGVAEMSREVQFTTRYYAYLEAGTSTFLFVAHMAAEAEYLWDKLAYRTMRCRVTCSH